MSETMTTKRITVRERAEKLFARVRQRQLTLARHGKVRESYRYARRADRIRRTLGWPMLVS